MKTLFHFILVYCCFAIPAKAQDAGFQNRPVYRIKKDNQGNLYIIGNYHGAINIDGITFGDSTYQSNGGFIAKLDSAANVIWAEQYKHRGVTGCGGNCLIWLDLEIDRENNLILAIAGDEITYKNQIYEANLMKLDSTGNVLWTKNVMETDAQNLHYNLDATVDGDNNIYIQSILQYSLVLDTFSLTRNYLPNDYLTYIAKLSPAGDVKWLNEIDSVYGNWQRSQFYGFLLNSDSLGNLFSWGRRDIGSTINTQPIVGPYIGKMDVDGTRKFILPYPITTQGNLWMNSSAISQKQNLFLSGSLNSSYYLSKIDVSNGNVIWQQSPPYSTSFNRSSSHDVFIDRFENSYLSGFFEGVIRPGNIDLYGHYYLSKYDSSGNYICSSVSDSNYISAGVSYDAHSYFTIGLSKYYLVHDQDVTLGHAWGNNKIQITKWNSDNCSLSFIKEFTQVFPVYPIGIRDKDLTEIHLFYPNPSKTGMFYFDESLKIKADVLEIYNITGQKIPFSLSNQLLDLSHNPKGIYFYRLILNKKSYSGKLLY